MKKYTLLLTFLLTVLIALNGCTVANISQDENIQEEKEAFAVDETQNEVEKTPDEVGTAVDVLVSDSHSFVNETGEGEILAPDGTVLATYDYAYPVFECNEGDNAEFVSALNEMFKNNALEMSSEAELAYEFLFEEYEYAEENNWSWIGPFDDRYGYEIHLDAKGILSVTETWYSYTGGAHGNARKESHTFDVKEGRELSLSDLLYGTDAEITQAFTNEFLKIKEEFFDDPSKIVPVEFPTAEYYVDAEGVTAYFQQYQVGSYASGFVSATISDKEMLKYDFSNTQEN